MPEPLERQVIRHRSLLRSFITRDLRTRYAGSGLGMAWAVIHPLLLLILYILVFSTLTRGGGVTVGGRIVGYTIFLCPALLAWNWMSESLIGACQSVTNNAALIRRVAFPSAILPVSSILTALIPYAVAMTLFLVFASIVGAVTVRGVLMLVVPIALTLAFLSGPAYLLAAMNVVLRDTAQFLMALLQVLFWSTPIVYAAETMTSALPWMAGWYRINPLTHIMDAFRSALLEAKLPPTGSLLYLVILSAVLYVVGRTVFMRAQRQFADDV